MAGTVSGSPSVRRDAGAMQGGVASRPGTAPGRSATTEARLRGYGVIPVVELHDAGQAEDLFSSLSEAGLPVAEITLRTPAGAPALERLVERHPEALLGAGTVRSVADARRVIAMGAAFVVSPGTDRDVIACCLEHDVLVLPGVCTPTEVHSALRAGARLLKFFPAEAAGGVAYLKALAGPFGEVSFVPTGGVSAANLADYLKLPQVAACGGSWMVAPDLLAGRSFVEVGRLARDALGVVEAVRGG